MPRFASFALSVNGYKIQPKSRCFGAMSPALHSLPTDIKSNQRTVVSTPYHQQCTLHQRIKNPVEEPLSLRHVGSFAPSINGYKIQPKRVVLALCRQHCTIYQRIQNPVTEPLSRCHIASVVLSVNRYESQPNYPLFQHNVHSQQTLAVAIELR